MNYGMALLHLVSRNLFYCKSCILYRAMVTVFSLDTTAVEITNYKWLSESVRSMSYSYFMCT
jgi:hypothetical protein